MKCNTSWNEKARSPASCALFSLFLFTLPLGGRKLKANICGSDGNLISYFAFGFGLSFVRRTVSHWSAHCAQSIPSHRRAFLPRLISAIRSLLFLSPESQRCEWIANCSGFALCWCFGIASRSWLGCSRSSIAADPHSSAVAFSLSRVPVYSVLFFRRYLFFSFSSSGGVCGAATETSCRAR